MAEVLEAGADGVGLFRTEFLFLNRGDLPSEDEQFEAYRQVAQAMAGRPVVLRTLDIGADKAIPVGDGGGRTMPNPAMGLRALRWGPSRPQVFPPPLPALPRACHYGKGRTRSPH